MAVDIKSAFGDGFAIFVQNMKTFALPLALGAFMIAIIVGFAPGLKKFLA